MNSTNSIKAAMKSFPIGQRRWTVALGLLLSAFALTASAQEVDIDAPTDGSTMTVNQPISLSAYADGGEMTISKVLFKENGIAIGSGDTSYPYTATFTPTTNGTYVFTAELIHAGNTLATSAPVTVTVSTGGGGGTSNVAPTVSMSSNPITAAAPATFNLSATAADSDGTVANVKFYADGALLGIDSSSPYTGTYTTSVSGAHTLTAIATDNSGASTTSAGVTVTVTGGSGGGGGGSGPTSVTRTYVYDTNERLCKVIDPEAGATVMDYDAAGNIAWIATGTTLTTSVCNRGLVTAAQKSTRSYDARNRMTNVATPGGAADVATKYTPDGLISSLVAANGAGGTNPVTTTYAYNKRRLLVSEGSAQPTYSYTLAYAYDANAHLSSLQYPDLQIVTYAPDGLGRVTAVQAGTQTYASGVSYFANGAISGFTYGNGVVHTMTQNARQLPTRSVDKKGATVVIDDTYAFDKNGNVTDITDQAQNGLTTRGMGYDALDRLTVAISPQQWGNATYSYDAIDNIRTANQGARQFNYNYDLVSNRLTSISGTSSYAFGYDVRGNVTSKGSQDFTFDPSNRMTTAELLSSTSVQTYRYDGTGRRVQTTDPGGQSNFWVYSQSGQVVYNHDERRGQNLAYIYLGNTQVATRTFDYSHGDTVSIRYQHTDALGSPVAETDAGGAVLKRNSFAPYGETYGATSIDGAGYAGHVMDRDTGLAYMQQRYMDPTIARFLSVDPIASDQGAGFGRYHYAGDNPYKYVDPDGRAFGTPEHPWIYGPNGAPIQSPCGPRVPPQACLAGSANQKPDAYKQTKGIWNKLVRNFDRLVSGGRAAAGFSLGLNGSIPLWSIARAKVGTGSVNVAMLELSGSRGFRAYSGYNTPSAALQLGGKSGPQVGWTGSESRSYWGAEDWNDTQHIQGGYGGAEAGGGQFGVSANVVVFKAEATYDFKNLDALYEWGDWAPF